MSVKLTSDDKGVKIFVKEREYEKDGQKKTFKVYSMGIASKVGENWVNGYFDVAFKKDDAGKINNKCKIKINNAFPTVTQGSGGKTYTKWMITDFEVLEEGEINKDVTNPDDFMQLDAYEDEMPFL